MNIAIIVTILAIAGTVIIMFNRLVKLRAFVREALSGIDVQLKRRHDLIPKLVDAVKGYSQYERNLFQEVTSIRTRISGARSIREKGEAENGLSRALKDIFALAEAYPDLKANQNFLDLQKNISEVEDEIQLARRYYNGTVRNYNIMIESFPSNFIARAFKFEPAEFFEIEYATERKEPDLKF